MRKALLVVSLLAGAGALPAQYARVRVWPPGFPTQIALDTMTAPELLDAPFGAVYTATIAAFNDMKIPLDTRDSTRGVVGNLGLRKSGSLAGSQMSRWFSCGNGMTGPNADNFRLNISVAALLDRDPATNKTNFRVAMVAGAEDVQGNAKDPVMCGSTGGIETGIMERVKKKVSTP